MWTCGQMWGHRVVRILALGRCFTWSQGPPTRYLLRSIGVPELAHGKTRNGRATAWTRLGATRPAHFPQAAVGRSDRPAEVHSGLESSCGAKRWAVRG